MRFLLLLALALASGCGSVVYKMDVSQGNLVDQKMVDKLKPGMTKRQVEVAMGTPLIASPFDQNQWNYLTAISHRGRKAVIKNLSLYFEGDTLTRIEGDWQPQDEDSLLAQSQALRPNGQRAKIPEKESGSLGKKERKALARAEKKSAKAKAKQAEREAKAARKAEKAKAKEERAKTEAEAAPPDETAAPAQNP